MSNAALGDQDPRSRLCWQDGGVGKRKVEREEKKIEIVLARRRSGREKGREGGEEEGAGEVGAAIIIQGDL